MATALVLSGGGSRGDFEVGAVRYLYERVWPGGHPDIICGTSVGAINAAKLAEGAGALDGLQAIWNGLRTNEDMYVAEQWFTDLSGNDLPSTVADFANESTFMKVTEVVTMLGNPFAMLWDTFDTIGDLVGLASAASDAKASKSLYNLGPIQAKLLDRATFDPAKVAASGIKLRLAMVGLASGALCWVDEQGRIFQRDGSPYQHLALAPECQPLAAQLADLDRQIKDEQLALHDARTKGGAIPVIHRLQAQRVEVQKALTACMAQHPPVLTPYRIAVYQGVLASASIPGVFPPQQAAGDWWVDGGIRAVLPVEAAVLAGATTIYAVAASRVAPDPATPLLGGDPIDIAQANFIDIMKHAADDILPNEVMHADTDPPRGWGVPMTVIRPMSDIHDGMTIDPGLIDIRVAEGYMRADDTLEAAKAVVIDTFAPTADDYSTIRSTQLIVALRHHIWDREGGLDATGLYPPYIPVGTEPVPTLPGLPTPPPPSAPLPPVDRLDELRDLKRQLRDAVRARIAAGGAMPAGYEQWWLTWERHRWTPNQPLWDAAHPLDPPGTLTVAALPAALPLGVPVEVTVRATDHATGRPVDGRVLVDGTPVAVTNEPFVQVLSPTTRFRIDPRTHAREPYDVDPVVTVAAGGYTTATVPCTFTASPPGQPPAAPPRISLRSVNYPTRYVRHQNFQGELTEIGSELDKRDGTFVVRPGLAAFAPPAVPHVPAAGPAPVPAPVPAAPAPPPARTPPHAPGPVPVPPHAPAPPEVPVPGLPHVPRGPVGKPLPHVPGGAGGLPRAFAAQGLAPGGPVTGGGLDRGPAGVSFESADYPGWFLCDQNGRLALVQRPATPTTAYLASATFRPHLGLAGAGMSFESLNGAGRYLRHRDFHLYVEERTAGAATFVQDATFTVAPPWSPA